MVNHYTAETIANWAGDFVQADDVKLFPGEVQDVAAQVLTALLNAACAPRGLEDLTEIGEADLKTALLEHVAKLTLPDAVQPFVPSLCRAFLTDLQTRGRLGHGTALGRYVGALKLAYVEASRRVPSTFVRPGSKIGRNDPCLCGSGKKYKNCCGK